MATKGRENRTTRKVVYLSPSMAERLEEMSDITGISGSLILKISLQDWLGRRLGSERRKAAERRENEDT